METTTLRRRPQCEPGGVYSSIEALRDDVGLFRWTHLPNRLADSNEDRCARRTRRRTVESQQGRDELILEATTRTALRKGDWVLIPPYKGPAVNTSVKIELGNSDDFQLYNLKEDISQKNNLASSNKEKLDEMIATFKKIRGDTYNDTEALELK